MSLKDIHGGHREKMMEVPFIVIVHVISPDHEWIEGCILLKSWNIIWSQYLHYFMKIKQWQKIKIKKLLTNWCIWRNLGIHWKKNEGYFIFSKMTDRCKQLNSLQLLRKCINLTVCSNTGNVLTIFGHKFQVWLRAFIVFLLLWEQKLFS